MAYHQMLLWIFTFQSIAVANGDNAAKNIAVRCKERCPPPAAEGNTGAKTSVVSKTQKKWSPLLLLYTLSNLLADAAARDIQVCRERKHNTGDGAQALALSSPRAYRQRVAQAKPTTHRDLCRIDGWVHGWVGGSGRRTFMDECQQRVSRDFCPLGFWGRRVFSSVQPMCSNLS